MIISKPFLSIVVPLYNEEKRLGGLDTIRRYFQKQPFSTEFVLVDDGSGDKTFVLLQKLPSHSNLKIISYTHNRGKGFAIRTGMLAAGGRFRLFMDIDLSTPVTEFTKFLPHLKKNHILIGSRKKTGAQLLVRQPWWRENLGGGFTRLSQLVLGVPLSDFTCGFKCFPETAARAIFSRQRIDRWGFDAEILFIAHRLGLTIKEIPVVWQDNHLSRVRLPHDIFSSAAELVQIRYHQWTHKYG